MELIGIEVKLTNGDIHYVEYEEGKEKFLDLVRFGEGAFLKDTKQNFFAVKSIISFKFKG
jgi:hypothetical protein